MTHICVSKLTIIGSDNGLSPGRHQAIIGTNVGIWLIRLLGINFSEILIGIQTFLFKKLDLQMSSAKYRPSCLGLNVLSGCLEMMAVMHSTATCTQYLLIAADLCHRNIQSIAFLSLPKAISVFIIIFILFVVPLTRIYDSQ